MRGGSEGTLPRGPVLWQGPWRGPENEKYVKYKKARTKEKEFVSGKLVKVMRKRVPARKKR